ncbi:MAG: hypothetical protein JWO67_4111 [Streptosporangiaceae bacterium]|nr:hypothetical protein [Streptosporangiaceae bacterium]
MKPEPPPQWRGCTHGPLYGCHAQPVVVDGIHGRRCGPHAPAFDPSVAVALAVHDSHAALAYVRVEFGEAS